VKPISDLDHYELLEVPRSASREEIERAYRLALETWGDDSLAGYSVVGDGDAAAVRERVDLAWRVLSDEESRRAYDAASLDPAPEEPVREAAPPPAEPLPAPGPFEELEEDEGDWDGGRLRRWRLRRGLDLDEIASVTKINPSYLHFIEEERFAELPARVYVRGFVSAFAQVVGLDADRVASSYLKRLEESRPRAERRRPW
jgi:curved DNA-binding protein CbpA